MNPLAPRLQGQLPLWLHALWALLLGALLLTAAPAQAQGSGGTITYIHTDISGSPLAATDAQGAVLWKESYRGYGQRWLQQGSGTGQSLWFHGKEQDEATGWQYFGARYYDPAVGRFMGMDPVDLQDGNLHSFNRYAYGNNNPVRYVDPDGGYAELAVEALSLAIGIDSFRKNIGSGNYAAAAVDGVGVAVDAAMAAVPGAPGVVGLGVRALRESGEAAPKVIGATTKSTGEVVHVTKGGIALPPGAKHQIPERYVQNPYRAGSYGDVIDGKFKERLRIDPPTPPGQKGPNHSHYHRDGRGAHYSPRPGDKDPGFEP